MCEKSTIWNVKHYKYQYTTTKANIHQLVLHQKRFTFDVIVMIGIHFRERNRNFTSKYRRFQIISPFFAFKPFRLHNLRPAVSLRRATMQLVIG